MLPIAVAIPLTHEGFDAVMLAFHKAIGKAHGQKLEKGEHCESPSGEGGEGFTQRIRSVLLHFRDPGIKVLCRQHAGRGSIPGPYLFLEELGHLQVGKLLSNACTLLRLFLGELFFGAEKECVFALQERLALFLVGPTLEDFLEPFHHMLDHVEMINDDVCGWRKQSWTARR
jgi:hypothetical protein